MQLSSKWLVITIRCLIVLALLAIGAALGWFWANKKQNQTALSGYKGVAIRSGENQYINPLLECDQAQSAFTELKPFEEQANSEVSTLEQDPEISSIAVYYRDMNNGPWFGISQDATFSPASLLKVPLAIAYYKLNEAAPGILQKTITFKGPDSTWPNITQTIPPKVALVVGQTYTVEQLIQHMLAYSDNQAYYLLFSNISLQTLQSVYKDFDLNLNGPGPADDTLVTVRGYSSFFRILFNASYLDQADSQALLSYLSNSDFNSGLVAGVPASVNVVHKFGERESAASGSLDELHDCGIVYYPNHPYLLCVMTQGTSLDKQAGAIQQISSLVYSQVDSQISGK